MTSRPETRDIDQIRKGTRIIAKYYTKQVPILMIILTGIDGRIIAEKVPNF
jgi:hypothetical protein